MRLWPDIPVDSSSNLSRAEWARRPLAVAEPDYRAAKRAPFELQNFDNCQKNLTEESAYGVQTQSFGNLSNSLQVVEAASHKDGAANAEIVIRFCTCGYTA